MTWHFVISAVCLLLFSAHVYGIFAAADACSLAKTDRHAV